MGIRCLLGHDFGGREVERDRREDGDEVVVAYRTVETCERCGSRRVISENKEIKPLGATAEAPEPASPTTPEPTPGVDASSPEPQGETGSSAAGDDSPSETAAERETATASAGGTTDAAEDAAIIIDDAPAAPADAADDDPSTPDLDAVAESESMTGLLDDETDTPDDGEMTVVDDGQTELLDEETDAPDDADDAAWSDAGADADDGFDAVSPTEGGPTVAADDPDGAPAPWPETDGVERDSNGTKFVRPDTETPDRDETTEFHCQSCGTTRSSSASSLRSGDVCPECRKGYLAERRVER